MKNVLGAQEDRRPNSPYYPSSPVLQLRDPDGTIHKYIRAFPEAPLAAERAGADEEAEPPHGKGAPARPDKPANPPPAVTPPPDEPLVLALARLLKDDPKALELLDRYDPPTRDWFQRILPLLASLNRTSVAKLPPEEVAHMQDQLQALLLALRARAELVIDKIYYSQPNPDPHNRFKPLPENHAFLPRSGDRPGECVCVYVELRNLGTVHKRDFYETRITSSLMIREKGDTKYAKVFKDRPLRSPDVSGDFFNTYSFYLPAGIPPGHYELVLEVRDETTQPARVAKRALPFVVTADAVAGN